MKRKSLLILASVLAVLLVFVLIKRAGERPIGIQVETNLERLLPEGLSTSDIARLELYAGAKAEEKVVLAWDKEGGQWRVTTHYDAPVSESKIEDYLDNLVKLKGEYRTTTDTEEELEQFNLTEERAFHMVGFPKDTEESLFHVLVGKAPDFRTVFVRKADDNTVFVEAKNLRASAGVYGDDYEKGPESGAWLDKQVLDLDKDKIHTIAVTGPDKKFVFEKREKKQAQPEVDDETGDDESEAEPEAEEVEYEWVLAEGGLGLPHKQLGLDSLLRRLDSLTANDIVDPTKKTDWELDAPLFACAVSVEGREEEVVIEGGRPDPGAAGYVRVASAKDDIVYELSKYTFEGLFPKGGDLFDLPSLSVDRGKIDRIELTQADGAEAPGKAGSVVLEKKGDEWTVVQPAADLNVQESTITTLVNALASWKPVDYADSAEGTGFAASPSAAPLRRVTFTVGPDESHVILLGAESKHVDGVHAQLDGEDTVLVMGRYDLDKMMVDPKDLYERTLLDIDEDDITEIRVERDTDSFRLARTGDAWALTVGDIQAEADADAAADLAGALARLQASDILFEETTFAEETVATIHLTMEDGAEYTFTAGPQEDQDHRVTLSGKKQVFLVAHLDIEEILPSSMSLEKPEPEPE